MHCALPPGKDPPVPAGQEAALVPERWDEKFPRNNVSGDDVDIERRVGGQRHFLNLNSRQTDFSCEECEGQR